MAHVLITGANRGIGLEFVRQYAKDGHEVSACCRKPEASQELQSLATSFPQVHIFGLEVTNYDQVTELGEKLREKAVDVLINNAGVYGGDKQRFGETDHKLWLETFQTNTLAPLKMAETFLPHLLAGEKKVIATITSKMGSITDNTSGGVYLYRSSKTAVNCVHKSMAIDLKDRGVIVLSIHPGWVVTDMGGPHALLTTVDSVQNMRKVIEESSLGDSGNFLNYDGEAISW